jgi:type IV pilus assembly protein PilY1
MKSALQVAASTLALAGLLAGVAHSATSIAELPLKASVLAKPNVVFAMDDSGSMDAEVMIDGNFQGWFYGNYQNATLYPGGQKRTGSVTADWPLFYLFPNGTGTGNRVYSDPNASYGYAIPPTNEVAWTRSADYNLIYYDSSKTYEPWSPAYVGGASTTYANASAGSVKSHPALGTTTMAVNADINSNTPNWRFTFLAGMTIPASASNVSCFFAAFPGTLPYTVETSRGLCTAQLSYYPATFWRKENCTANGTDCITNFDGNTLRRYEIKVGNTFPSGRSYTDEMQNFANWFQYYRKRRMLLAAAMGEVLENISGLRMGVVAFNNRVAPTIYDADATDAASNRLAVAGIFYRNEGGGGTPTHATMSYIHGQFDTNTAIIQYACQRNAQFIITDGFANDSFSVAPLYSAATYGAAAPYQTVFPTSLHDKALAFFTNRLRATTSPLAAGKVPTPPSTGPNPDTNPDLHLNTYALTLGMKGTLWPNTVDPFVTAPTWPTPVSNTATMIDDLWHATINGRGQMYLATDAQNTALAIQAGLNDILSATGAQGGVAVSTVNLPRGDSRAYFGRYNPAGWSGDLTAQNINVNTGEISTAAQWSAATVLSARPWGTRLITAFNGGGVSFSEAAVGSLVNPGGVYGTTSQVMDYLRGDRTHEGTLFRKRSSLMGAVINSEPAVDRETGVAYVASGEGMLHAIDIKVDPGKELWAHVPREVLNDIGLSTQRGYAFKTKLDGSPVIAKIGANKLMVSGMGAAGRSYYAIDVSNPRVNSESAVASMMKWEFPSAGDTTTQAKVGQTLGRPLIVKVGTDYRVLVTSGYNNTADGKGRLWMLNASTGAVVKEFVTTDGSLASEAGLAHVSGFLEGNGTVRYVYGGDLLGNLWRFDLQADPAAAGAVNKVAQFRSAAGTVQPVTAPPELLYLESQRVIFVGTGRLLDIGDFSASAAHTMYAVADGSTLTDARSTLIQRSYNAGTDTVTGDAVDWKTQRGWYLDLPTGHHANTQPTVAYGALAFSTNYNSGSDCTASSKLFLVDSKTGKKFEGSDFVSTDISTTSNTSGVTALRTLGGGGGAGGGDGGGGGGGDPCSGNQIVGVGQDADGKPWKRKLVCGTTINPGKNAWREIRR